MFKHYEDEREYQDGLVIEQIIFDHLSAEFTKLGVQIDRRTSASNRAATVCASFTALGSSRLTEETLQRVATGIGALHAQHCWIEEHWVFRGVSPWQEYVGDDARPHNAPFIGLEFSFGRPIA